MDTSKSATSKISAQNWSIKLEESETAKKTDLSKIVAKSIEAFEEIKASFSGEEKLSEKEHEIVALGNKIITSTEEIVTAKEIKNIRSQRFLLVASVISAFTLLFFPIAYMLWHDQKEKGDEIELLKKDLNQMKSDLKDIQNQKSNILKSVGVDEDFAKELIELKDENILNYIDQIHANKEGNSTIKAELKSYVEDIRNNKMNGMDLNNAAKLTSFKKRIKDETLKRVNGEDFKYTIQGGKKAVRILGDEAKQSGIEGEFEVQLDKREDDGTTQQFQKDIIRGNQFQIGEGGLTEKNDLNAAKQAIKEATINKNSDNSAWKPILELAASQTSLNATFLPISLDISQWGSEVNFGEDISLVGKISGALPPPKLNISYNTDGTISGVEVQVKINTDLLKKDASKIEGAEGQYKEFIKNGVQCSLTYSIKLDENNKPIITVLNSKYEMNKELAIGLDSPPPPLTEQRKIELLKTLCKCDDAMATSLAKLKEGDIPGYINRINKLETGIKRREESYVDNSQQKAELEKVKAELKAYVDDIQLNKDNDQGLSYESAANLTGIKKYIREEVNAKQDTDEVETSIGRMFQAALAKYDMPGEETEFETDFKRQNTFTITDEARKVNKQGPIPNTTYINETEEEFKKERANLAKKELAAVTNLGDNNKWQRALETAPTQTSLRAAFSNQIGTITFLGSNVTFSEGKNLKAEISGDLPTVDLKIIRGSNNEIEKVEVEIKGNVDLVQFDPTKENSESFIKDAITAELSYSIQLDDEGNPIIKDLILKRETSILKLGSETGGSEAGTPRSVTPEVG